MTKHTPSSPRNREQKKDSDRDRKVRRGSSVSSSQAGSVLDFLLSLLRKMPITVAALVVALLVYYQQPDEEPLPRFHEPPDSTPASLPAELSSPETKHLLPLVQWVKAFDSDLLRSRWGNIYLGIEARQPDGKVLTITVTEKWQGLSLEERREMVQEVINTWVRNGQALGLLRSAEELAAVHFKLVPSEQPVATWQPASGPRFFTPG